MMMNMNRKMIQRRALSVMLLSFLTLIPLCAQPAWVKKATKSVFTLKTFAADGSLIGSSNGRQQLYAVQRGFKSRDYRLTGKGDARSEHSWC